MWCWKGVIKVINNIYSVSGLVLGCDLVPSTYLVREIVTFIELPRTQGLSKTTRVTNTYIYFLYKDYVICTALYLWFSLEEEHIRRIGLVMRSIRLSARGVDDPTSKDDGTRSSKTKRKWLKYPATVIDKKNLQF
jgi:hypothetical protein